MKEAAAKLSELKREMKGVVIQLKAGAITPLQAADRIAYFREEMDKTIEALKSKVYKK